MRELCEGVMRNAALECLGTTEVTWGDKVIDLGKPFRWVSMAELVEEKTGIDFTAADMTYEKAVALAKEKGVELEKHFNSVGHILNAFFEEFCEKDLIQPTFVHSYPIEVSPLTKREKNNPNFTDRFEIFINGFEFANAYTELNDPIDQKERFVEQLKAKERGDEEASEMDVDFVEALEYGMPPAGGIGIGIDRFVMFLANQPSIREVILFPCMKDR